MRTVYFVFLLAFLAVVGLFAYLNDRTVSIVLPGETREVSFPLLVGATYLLGMVSGWTVVGLVGKSWRRVSEPAR